MMRNRALLTTTALCAVLLAGSALGQSAGGPPVTFTTPGATQQPAQVHQVVGLDTVSGLPCLVGSVTTCQLPGSSSGGGGGGGGGAGAPFVPNGATSPIVTATSSARTALTGVGPVFRVRNPSTTIDAEVAFGDNTVVATSTSQKVPAGATVDVIAYGATSVATIALSAGSLEVTPGAEPLLGASDQVDATGATLSAADVGSTTIAGMASVTLVTGTPTANSAYTVAINGRTAFSFSIPTTGWTGSLAVETSVDGTNWVPRRALIMGADPCSQSVTTQAITGAGVFLVNTSGQQKVRVRAGTLSAGSPVVRGTASNEVDAALQAAQVALGQCTTAVGIDLQKINGTTIPTNNGDSTAATPRVVLANPIATYSAGLGTTVPVTALAPAASATDIYTLTGPSGAVARVRRIQISCTATAAGSYVVNIVKRSTATSAGTSTSPTVVSHDSNNAAAGGVVKAYTANPTLGTLVGVVRTQTVTVSTSAGAIPEVPTVFEFTDHGGQALTLRGNTETASINLNSVTMTGGACTPDVEWTESAS